MRQHPPPRDRAEGGFISGHPAEGRRADHRTAGLGADGKRDHSVRHRRGRALRRSAGRMRQIMRVRGLAGLHEGKLGRDRLTHQDRPFLAQPLYHKGVAQGHAPRILRAAVFRGNALGVDHVLQRDRQPVKPPQGTPCPAMRIQRAGLCAREFGIEPRPCTDLRLARLDPLDIAVDQRQRIQRAGRQPVAQQRHAGGAVHPVTRHPITVHKTDPANRRRSAGRHTSAPSTGSRRRGTA